MFSEDGRLAGKAESDVGLFFLLLFHRFEKLAGQESPGNQRRLFQGGFKRDALPDSAQGGFLFGSDRANA